MYEMKRQVNCSELGADGLPRNSALVDYLQDCSLGHLDNEPALSPFFQAESCIMFLVSRQLDIIRKPCCGEKITMKTWCWELKRLYGYRNTIVYGEDGKPCIMSYATGAFMDSVTHRSRKIPQELVDKVEILPRAEMEYTPRKIILPQCEAQLREPLNILKCFIDMNGHVNNARYLDITDEYIPDDAKVKRIRLEYKMPLKRGCEAYVSVFRQGDLITVSIEDPSGNPYCIVEYTFE